MLDRSVQLRHSSARPLLAGVPLEQQANGRTCGHDDCHTRLSRYNPSTVCAEHAGWRDATRRPRSASSGVEDI